MNHPQSCSPQGSGRESVAGATKSLPDLASQGSPRPWRVNMSQYVGQVGARWAMRQAGARQDRRCGRAGAGQATRQGRRGAGDATGQARGGRCGRAGAGRAMRQGRPGAGRPMRQLCRPRSMIMGISDLMRTQTTHDQGECVVAGVFMVKFRARRAGRGEPGAESRARRAGHGEPGTESGRGEPGTESRARRAGRGERGVRASVGPTDHGHFGANRRANYP
jgi:hypothetical protein